MQTDKLLKFYWEIFLSHICEFHPLDKDFIDKYEYELDWVAISKNRNISWNIDILEKYETRFSWHELAWNESILWNEEKIDRFKKRLDWYYLGRNRNLPITEDFIIKYAKKLFVVEDNPLLTKILIDKHNIKIVPKNTFDTQNIKTYNSTDFDSIFNKSTFHHNQKVIYQLVFLPIIRESSLEKIFEEKFNYSQRYYYLEPINDDIHGLTPEFEIKGINPFEQFREDKEDREPFAINEKLTLVNGSLQEGPDRLYEIPRIKSFSFYTTILISENVKQVLEQFKLPNHIYHEVNLIPKKITTSTRFFILQLAFDTLNKDLIYDNNSFSFSFKDFKNRGNGVVEDEINNPSELMAVNEKLNKIYSPVGYGVRIYPGKYKLKTDYDLYTYSVFKKIIVNQYLKDVLEKNFPGQILFKSAQLLNIEMEQSAYETKKQLAINTKLSSKLTFRESDEDKFFYSKKERLEKFDPPIEITKLKEDKFTKIEKQLNVIFPEVFKNNYIAKRIKINDYSLLDISKFYLQNEYADRYPETYKSVAIAENGVGDSVNLILERSSDHKLQNRFFEFFHETGEFEEI